MAQNKRLIIGEGKISGYLSIFLAIICLGTTICAYFPEYLTTSDFRELYKPNYIKWIFLIVLVLSFGFALTSFILSKKTKLGFLGILLIAGSIFLATGLPEYQNIESKSFTIGLDWLLIDILISATFRSSESQLHPRGQPSVPSPADLPLMASPW